MLRFFQRLDDGFLRLFIVHAVKGFGIDQYTRPCIRQRFLALFRLNDLNNRQIVFGGKNKIALVVCRHGHHTPCTIGIQYIVGNPNRHLAPVDGVDGIGAGEHTGLFPYRGQTVDIRSLVCLFTVRLHRRLAFWRSDFIHHRMLRRNDTIGVAK